MEAPPAAGLRRERVLPGLLPWHKGLIVFLLGIFAVRDLAPALVGLALFVVLEKSLGGRGSLWKGGCVFLFAFVVGWAAHPQPPPQEMPQWMADREVVRIRGEVERVEFKPENRAKIIVSQVQIRPLESDTWQPWPASLVWTWYDPSMWPGPGQEVELEGRVKPVQGFANPGTWNTRAYWGRRDVWYKTYTDAPKEVKAVHGRASWSWRTRLALRETVLAQTEPGGGRGLVLSLLMGDRSELSYDALDLVRRGSLAHSLALSGLHVGFIVGIGAGLAWAVGWVAPGLYMWLPRAKWAILLAAPLVAGYLWLGQGAPSLVRASVMFGAWGVLLWQGRSQVLLDGLFWAVLVLVCVDPLCVYDLGVQLSVTAVAGLIVLGRTLAAGWQRLGSFLPQWLLPLRYALGVMGVSALANVVLLPLVTANFGFASPHLYLNALWLPLLGLGVLPLALVGVLGWLLPGASAVGALGFGAAARLAEAMFAGLSWLDAQGWLEEIMVLRPLWPQAFGYWLLLGALVLAWAGYKRFWPVVAVGLALLVGPTLAAQMEQGRVRLTVLDVGQGQAVLLRGPSGRRILIDGGGSWNPDFDLARFAVLPALTQGAPPRLDTAVLTHPDFDHHRGMQTVVDTCQVERFAFNGQWPAGDDGRDLRAALAAAEVPVQTWQAGDRIALGEGYRLEVLHPPAEWRMADKNDSSLVLRLWDGERGLALLCGDIEKAGVEAVLESGVELQSEVLVLPHHGSRSSLAPEFYAAVDPSFAVASAAFLHPFRFPHLEVRQALRKQEVELLTTAESGAVRITWEPDGSRRMEELRHTRQTWP
ncbi:MAG: DNA internalization-related competence protein ComEC/Rec2 [Thermodesulfobacteriota bacterium]